MKRILRAQLIFIVAVLISGCNSTIATTTPVAMETGSLTPSDMPTLMLLPTQTTRTPIYPPTILSTSTSTIPVTPTVTLTPIPTLDAEQAREVLTAYLHDGGNCQRPCFLGIFPGETTIAEAQDIFTHHGLPISMITFEGKDIYGTHYDFDTGLSIRVNLTVQDDIVMNIRIDITPEITIAESPYAGLAFSPERVITTYGMPTRVEIWMDFPSRPLYAIAIFYDELDLIIQYGYAPASLSICPLKDAYEGIRVWMGANPSYPPLGGVPLEEAASMTIEQFSNLVLGNQEQACFTVDQDAFLP